MLAFLVYLRTLAPTVAIADGYELQVVSATLGVAHPTGYPLYTLVGKLFTLLPFGDLAYRVNLFSAVSAALGVGLIAATIHRLTRSLSGSVVGALTLAFSLTYWRQAVIAEKYALNAAFVAAMLFLAAAWLVPKASWRPSPRLIAFAFGLSLTHHRTMLLLAPAILLAVLLGAWSHRAPTKAFPIRLRDLPGLALAGAAPLVIYAYLPIRIPMNLRALVRHVSGSEYQGALRWASWLNEPDRVDILGRLMRMQVTSETLAVVGALAVLGLLWLLWRRRAFAVCSLVGAVSVLVFAASYYADYNDANYLLPVYVVASTWIGAGAATVTRIFSAIDRRPLHARSHSQPTDGLTVGTDDTSSSQTSIDREQGSATPTGNRAVASKIGILLTTLMALALTLVPLAQASGHFTAADASGFRRHVDWAEAALTHVEPGATVLAHGERFAALAYLAHVLDRRPDVDIQTFPTEGDYLRRIDADLAAGRTVYTARRIFGGSYFFESAGPLTRVLSTPPANGQHPPPLAQWGRLSLIGANVGTSADKSSIAADLKWLAREPLGQNLRFRLRLVGPDGVVWAAEQDGVPVDGNLPTPIWPVGVTVADRHELAVPTSLPPATYLVEVGVHLDFHFDTLPTDDGLLYVSLGTIVLDGGPRATPWTTTRVRFGDGLVLVGYDLGQHVEAGGTLHARLYWQATRPLDGDLRSVVRLADDQGNILATSPVSSLLTEHLASTWTPASSTATARAVALLGMRSIRGETLAEDHRLVVPPSASGRVRLEVSVRNRDEELSVRSGWFENATASLPLPWQDVAPPHPLRDDAISLPTNFGNRLRLLAARVESAPVQPGAYLNVLLDWEALAPADEDYVVFVQATADQPGMWLQEDRGPAQGAYLTTLWQPGEVVPDRHRISLPWDLPPGTYRLQIGVYRPSDLRRLPVLDEHGRVIGDLVAPTTVEVRPR